MDFTDYSMRPIAEGDLALLLEWRNSPKIHSMMLTDHLITWEEHVAWFGRICQYEPKLHFITEYKRRPMGYFGFSNVDYENRTCYPGGYQGINVETPIDAACYGAFMYLEYAFQTLQMKRLESLVFAKNKHAIGMNKFMGYFIEEELLYERNGVSYPSVRIVITREDWKKRKLELLEIL